MDKQAFLILLLCVQLLLLALDLFDYFGNRKERGEGSPLRPRSVLFLLATITVYALLQFGGLALAPSGEDLLLSSRAVVDDVFANNSGGADIHWSGVMLVGIFSFYLHGLIDYLFHRFVSHSRPMWFSHENHHLATNVSLFMPGLCVRPFAVFVILPTSAASIFALQFALGLSGFNGWNMLPMLYAVVLVQLSVLALTHSSFLRRYWWIHEVLSRLGIATPQEHWLHHTADLECNYGNLVTFWDRVFGTYVDPAKIDLAAHRAGLSYDQDFLGAITIGRLKLSERIRARYQLREFCYLEAKGTRS